jgi:hypothetical protein
MAPVDIIISESPSTSVLAIRLQDGCRSSFTTTILTLPYTALYGIYPKGRIPGRSVEEQGVSVVYPDESQGR